MPARDLKEGDLTRSSNNGTGVTPKVTAKPLKALGKPTGRRARKERALPGGFEFKSGPSKPVVLPGRQVKTEVDGWMGYTAPLDERRRTIQNEDTIDAIKAIRDIDPSVGNAVWNYLRLINPGHDLKAYVYGSDGSEIDEAGEGQKYLDALAEKVGKDYGGGLDQLHNVLALVLLTNGAAAIEVEVNSTLSGVVDWHAIDPLVLSFRYEEEADGVKRLHLGQDIGSDWERLNEQQVFYFPLDPDINDPYGRPPMVAAVQQVLYLAQLQADTRAMAHQQGFPRLDIKVLWEQIQQAAPPAIRDDPQAFQEWASAQLTAIVTEYEDLNTDDVFIHYNFVEVGTAGGVPGAFNFEALDKIITRRLTQSLKALPITLGINDSTSETHGSIQWQIQVAGIENFQRCIKRLIERAANLSLQVRGIQAHAKLHYEEIRTVDRLYEAQADYYDRRNAQFDVQMGWATNDEAAERVVGHSAVSDPLIDLSGGAADGGQGPMGGGEGDVSGAATGDSPWWAGLFPEAGGESPGGPSSTNPDPNQIDLPGGNRGDTKMAWFHFLMDENNREVDGFGHQRFRPGSDTPTNAVPPRDGERIASADDPLNDVTRFAEKGEAIFRELKRELIETLVAEGFLEYEGRDTASDVSASFRRSLARQMKGLLREAMAEGMRLANDERTPPERHIDRIWKRNKPYLDKISDDLARAIRAGQVADLDAIGLWFERNAYRERLMGKHMGKQGVSAGWSYSLAELEDLDFVWTRTIEESCDTCVDRGGQVYTFDELLVQGFPGSDSLDCGANCLCVLEPVERSKTRAFTRGIASRRDFKESDHPRWEKGTEKGGEFKPKDGVEAQDLGGDRPRIGDPGEGLTAEEYEAYYRERHRLQAEWEKAIQHDVSVGLLDPAEAFERGWNPSRPSHPEDVELLPDDLYHATMAVDSVLATGLKTRDELVAAGVLDEALGGGADDTISFTTSADVAARIAEVLRQAIDVGNGDVTHADFLAIAERQGWGSKLIETYEYLQGKGSWDRLERGVVRDYDMSAYTVEDYIERNGDEGWQPAPDSEPLVGGDGKVRYFAWERPMSTDERAEAEFSAFEYFLTQQEAHGGPISPLFWAAKPSAFRGKSKAQVRVVRAHPIPGARGYRLPAGGGLDEWRTWTGDAVYVELANEPVVDSDWPIRVIREFKESDHPRWEAGTEGGKGGKFKPKGETGESDTEITPYEAVGAEWAEDYANAQRTFRQTPGGIKIDVFRMVGGGTMLDPDIRGEVKDEIVQALAAHLTPFLEENADALEHYTPGHVRLEPFVFSGPAPGLSLVNDNLPEPGESFTITAGSLLWGSQFGGPVYAPYSGVLTYDGTKVTIMPDYGSIYYRVAHNLIQSWAASSTDDSMESLRMQMAVADVFGKEFGVSADALLRHQDEKSRGLGLEVKEGQRYEALWGNLPDPAKELYRMFVRWQYDRTQAHLAGLGIDWVPLFRGGTVHSSARGSVATIGDSNPASSWSIAKSEAVSFAKMRTNEQNGQYETHLRSGGSEYRAFVWSARVPRRRVLATAVTGVGCLSEQEFVVIGGDGDAGVEQYEVESYDV